VAGARPSQNLFQLDGTTINDALNNTPGSAQGLLVGVETVKEFRVLTTNYSAEYGRATGGVFIAVTKSGTNQFHGSGFEFLRNDALDAANFFDNASGLGKGPFRRNQFGFTVGGPVVLPFGEGDKKLYNGKNKTFFFFSYEGLRSSNTDTVNTFVETPEFRQLVAAQRPNSIAARILTAPGVQPRVVSVIPTTCAFAGFPFGSFNQCAQVGSGLDIGRLAGAQAQYLSFGALNGGGLDGIPDIQFAQLAVPTESRGNQFNPRIDLNLTQRDILTFSSYVSRFNGLGSDSGGRSRPMGDIRTAPNNLFGTLTWVHTLSQSAVNEAAGARSELSPVVAAALGLVLARLALGRGGALKATVAFLVLRGGIALVVGPSLHHTVPRFPLYVVAALVVEAAAWWVGDERPLRLALVSGVLVGTVGLAAEVVYAAASGWLPPSPPIALPAAVLGVAGGVSAAVLGAGLAGAALGSKGVSRAALGLAGAALLACLAIPLPRNVGPVEATIRLQPAGPGQARVDVELSPPDAARHASAFGVVSWQGGGRIRAALKEVGPGRYVASRPLPITGSWKTMVGLQRADQVMAAPIYLPADPRIRASAVPALPERRVAFARNTDVLLREAHGGPAWPAVVAYSGLALILALWIGLWAFTARRAAAEAEGAEPPAPPAHAPTGPWPAGRGAVVRPSG
jgi:hypothetical protein